MAKTFPDLRTGVAAVQPMESNIFQKVLISEYEDSKEQRRLVWSQEKSEYSIEYRGLSDSDKSTLVSFYKSVNGPYEEFSIRIPNGVGTITARFSTEPIRVVDNAINFDVYLKVVEVL